MGWLKTYLGLQRLRSPVLNQKSPSPLCSRYFFFCTSAFISILSALSIDFPSFPIHPPTYPSTPAQLHSVGICVAGLRLPHEALLPSDRQPIAARLDAEVDEEPIIHLESCTSGGPAKGGEADRQRMVNEWAKNCLEKKHCIRTAHVKTI